MGGYKAVGCDLKNGVQSPRSPSLNSKSSFAGSRSPSCLESKGASETPRMTSASLRTLRKKHPVAFVSSEGPRVGTCETREYSIDEKRRKRQCIVCRWENRIISVQTLRDHTHNVSLCMQPRRASDPKPYMCPNTEWSCWKKYHDYYYPSKLYNLRGNICRSNKLYKLRQQLDGDNATLKF